jgi:hypothetical protein
MKRICFALFISLFINCCFAQDPEVETERKTPNDFYREKYHVLKSNPTVKQGLYQALYRSNIALASGNFTNGKKTGVWHYYDPTGLLLENYDYDKKIFLYEAPEDTLSDFRYYLDIDRKLTDSDKFVKPLKIGGRYFGYIPYLTAFAFPYDTAEVNTDSFNVEVQLLISPLGRLADYRVRVSSTLYKYDQTTTISLELFSEDDKQFTPAILNGQPVLCRILIRCYMTETGYIGFY